MKKHSNDKWTRSDLGQYSCRNGYNYQDSVIINKILESFLKNDNILHGVEFIQDYFQQENNEYLYLYQIKYNSINKKSKIDLENDIELLSKMNINKEKIKHFFITSNKKLNDKNNIFIDSDSLDKKNVKKIMEFLNLKNNIKQYIVSSVIIFFKKIVSLDKQEIDKNYFFNNYEDISLINLLSQEEILNSKYEFKFFNKKIIINKLEETLKREEIISINFKIETVEEISKYLNDRY